LFFYSRKKSRERISMETLNEVKFWDEWLWMTCAIYWLTFKSKFKVDWHPAFHLKPNERKRKSMKNSYSLNISNKTVAGQQQ